MAGCILLYVIHSKMWPLNLFSWFFCLFFSLFVFNLFIYFSSWGNGFQHAVALSRAHQLASLKSLKCKINQGTKDPAHSCKVATFSLANNEDLNFPGNNK